MTVSSTRTGRLLSAAAELAGGGAANDCVRLLAQLEALYRYDARGRIVASRDPGVAAAPRLHLGRTRHGHSWRMRADLPDATARVLSRLVGREPLLTCVGTAPAPPERAAAIQARLDALHPVERVFAGPVFRLPDTPTGAAGLVAAAEGASLVDALDDGAREALLAAFPDLRSTFAGRAPFALVCDGDRIAAVAYRASGDLPGPVEVGVQTLEPYRRRGFGRRAVAAWLRGAHASGAIPFYSAEWSNRASLALARSLGLVPFADTLHWT